MIILTTGEAEVINRVLASVLEETEDFAPDGLLDEVHEAKYILEGHVKTAYRVDDSPFAPVARAVRNTYEGLLILSRDDLEEY